MKKIFISVLTVLSLATFNNVEAQTSSSEKVSSVEEKQQHQLKEYKDLLKEINSDSKFSDEYGGIFFNDDSELVINLVHTSKGEFASKVRKSDLLHYSEVNYSKKELDETMEKLMQKIPTSLISSIEICEESNSIIIHTKFDITDINDLVKEITVVENITIIQDNNTMKPTLTSNVYLRMGEEIVVHHSTSSISYQLSTGFGAKNSSGDSGIVTAGHDDYNLNSTVTYYPYYFKIGKVTQKEFHPDEGIDASFIKLNHSFYHVTKYYPSRSLNNGDYYNTVYLSEALLDTFIVQNQVIRFYGAESNVQTGKILNKSFSTTLDGVVFKKFVKTDYIAIKGDSGGPVTTYTYLGGYYASNIVIGIQSFSYLNDDYAWVEGVSYSCFSRSDFIMDKLNLTPYI